MQLPATSPITFTPNPLLSNHAEDLNREISKTFDPEDFIRQLMNSGREISNFVSFTFSEGAGRKQKERNTDEFINE